MVQFIFGTPGADTLTGTNPGTPGNLDGIDIIFGFGGDDTLSGLGSPDAIDGGSGNDVINGGASGDLLCGDTGMDTLSYAGSNAAVTVNLATQTASGGWATGDVLSGFESAIGSDFNDIMTTGSVTGARLQGGLGNDTLTGAANAQTLDGDAGDDTLSGLGGTDTLNGGAGTDRLLGGAGADAMDGGAGTYDTVSYQNSNAGGVTVSLVDGSVGAGGDAAGDTINGFENVVGSNLNDVLTGNDLGNVLVGGTGADVMTGGIGNDYYDVDNLGDVVNETVGEGTDTIYTSIDYALLAGASIEKLAAFTGGGSTDLTGNEIKQTIYGNESGNVITGLAAADVLLGLGGADTFGYTAVGDSATGSADTIANFSGTGLDGDLIDLSDVFSSLGITGSFIGTGPYTGTAGQVRYTPLGATQARIGVDTDGNSVDDMQIIVTGTNAVVSADFVL